MYLGKCSQNKFSVHERSDCEHCQMFLVPLPPDLKSAQSRSAQYDLLCRPIHCAMCRITQGWWDQLISMCALRADSGLRAKPRPGRTCSQFHIVQTSFQRRTKGRFVQRSWFDRVPAGIVLAGTRLFKTRSDYKKWCVPTCSLISPV